MNGRRSMKRERLMTNYRFLRASMTTEDVAQLKKDRPSYFDIEDGTDITDVYLGSLCDLLIDVMSKVSPPKWEGREPL